MASWCLGQGGGNDRNEGLAPSTTHSEDKVESCSRGAREEGRLVQTKEDKPHVFSDMKKIVFLGFLTVLPVSIPAQEVGEAQPGAENQRAVNAPELVGNKRRTFRIRNLRASDVLSVAQRAISIISLRVVIEEGERAGRDAPEEKNTPESALIGKTLLVADGISNTLIVHGPPKHIKVIRDLIAAIDVDLEEK